MLPPWPISSHHREDTTSSSEWDTTAPAHHNACKFIVRLLFTKPRARNGQEYKSESDMVPKSPTLQQKATRTWGNVG